MEPTINQTPIVEPIDSTINIAPQPIPTPPAQESPKTNHGKIIATIICITLVGAGLFIYKTFMTKNTQKEAVEVTEKIDSITSNVDKIGYLEKSDQVYKLLTSRMLNDLHQSALKSKPDSLENKSIVEKLKKATPEQKQEISVLYKKSLSEYITKTGINIIAPSEINFIQNFQEIGVNMVDKDIYNQYDIRIKNIGNNEYVVEFWYDVLKNTPEGYKQQIEEAVKDGTTPPYAEQITLLYMVNGNDVIFKDPLQAVYDFGDSL